MPVFAKAQKILSRKRQRDRHVAELEAGEDSSAKKKAAAAGGSTKRTADSSFIPDEDLVSEGEVERLQQGFNSDGEQSAAEEGSPAVTTDDEDDDDEEDDEEESQTDRERQARENKRRRLENPAADKEIELELQEPSSWVERMALSATKPLPEDLNPDDDPKREELFMKHALISVKRGIALLEKEGIPWRRPADFYAEMFKTDVHMDKIRTKIETNKKKIEMQQQARDRKEARRFGKEVQAKVQEQRSKSKREMLAKVSDWRKKKRRDDNQLDDILNEDDQDDDRRGGKGGKGGKGKKGRSGPGRQSTGKSRQKHAERGKSHGGGGGGGRRGGGGAGKRPGKNARGRR